jgi:hypothetical protein
MMQIAGHKKSEENTSIPSVKDMPVFDPDAEITALALTVPSWCSSIERTRVKVDLSIVSGVAKNKLVAALNSLQNQIAHMLSAIEVGENHE